MEQEPELTTSSSEHLSTAPTASVAPTAKKRSAKSRLAQPFKSLVGRSTSLKAKSDDGEMQRSGDLAASGPDTLPRALKPKSKDKKKAKAAQSGDEAAKPKDVSGSAEDVTSEDGKRARKKKTSIVRRLSNKIRTGKQDQESAATSEMSTADMTSEDTHSMTSSSTYGAKTPEHPTHPLIVDSKGPDTEWTIPGEAVEPHQEEELLQAAPPPPTPEAKEALDAPAIQEPSAPLLESPQQQAEEKIEEPAKVPEPESSPEGPTVVDATPLPPKSDTAQNGERREHLYKILVIGELGTGKTSIIKRYVHQFFSQHYRATIGVDFALKVLTWDQNTIIRLQLWDIAGQERFGNMTRVYYKEAVGAFIVFDVTRTATFDAVLKWKADLDSKVQLPDGSSIPCVLLANKCDQQKEGIVNNPAKMDDYCKDNGFSGWYETSAKENINIDEAARFLVSKILQNDRLANHTSNNDGFSLDNADGEQNQKSCAC